MLPSGCSRKDPAHSPFRVRLASAALLAGLGSLTGPVVSQALAAATLTSVTGNVACPVNVGTAVTWTAMATGGTAPLQYKFQLYNQTTASWSLLQDYSTSNQAIWTTTAAGSYNVQVWVRSAGSMVTYEAWRNSVTCGVVVPPVSVTGVVATPPAPRAPGTDVTWTASATGGTAPLQYKFMLYNITTASWSQLRDYEADRSVEWTTGGEGRYYVQVWVRSAGSAADYEAVRNSATYAVEAGRTTRVSVATGGGQGTGESFFPAISADGRFVAFDSDASDLVNPDTNGAADVFVRDRATGTTTRVSVGAGGAQANGPSSLWSLSADGRFVAFASTATNLVPGDTNGFTDVFLHDRQTGTTSRVSVGAGGAQANSASFAASLSADGRLIAFASFASNLVSGDTNATWDVFVRDRLTGTTARMSTSTGGAQGNDMSLIPSISPDGRYVAFESWATNLVAGDTNGEGDIFVRDRATGQTTRVSVATGGGQASADCEAPWISTDGRFVAFHSLADDLVLGDTNGRHDVFVHDRQTGTTTRVSVATGGAQAGDSSFFPVMSADGRFVAFESFASNLAGGDPDASDVFVHDRQTGETTRVSVDSGGGQATGDSFVAAISADGQWVAFRSFAPDLVAGDSNGVFDIFVRDRLTTTAPIVTLVSTSTLGVQPAGTSIVWTAYAAGGPAPLQYKFQVYDVGAASWSLLQDYSTRNVATWRPVTGGTFYLQVWVRAQGSVNAFDAWRNGAPMQITAPPSAVAITGVTISAPCPISLGSPLVVTGSATGGVAPLEYKFWLRNQTAGTWDLLRDYGPSNQIAATAEEIGTYYIQLWVRSKGFPGSQQAAANSASCSVVTPPVTVTSVSPSPASPVAAGTPVTWTAMATGGTAPLQYRFLLQNTDTKAWTILQEYSADNTADWATPAAGNFLMQVWVRSAGSAAAYEAWRNSSAFVVTP